MSVSGADPVQDKLEPIELPISNQDHATVTHEQPADVSIPSDKPSSGSPLGDPLSLPKEDASNGDVSGNAEPSALDSSVESPDAANGHPPTADAVPEAITAHSKENAATEHVSDNTTDAPEALLGTVATASDSVAAENLADMAVTAENISIKEPDNAPPATDVADYAMTAEHQESSTSDSVTILAEESLADKTINDSAIEISPPALEKKQAEKDGSVADKLDVEAVEPAIGGESAVVVEDTHEETNHTQVDGTHVEEASQIEEAKDVVFAESEGAVVAETDPSHKEESGTVLTTEAQEAPKAAADEETRAAEQVEIDQVVQEQPQAEATTEVLVAEANGPEGSSGAVGGVNEQQTGHEAVPVAAEINNVGDSAHEAVVVDDEPRTTVVEEANGNEATLEQLDEQPEVTVHVETAPFVEEPQADEDAVSTVVGQVEELAGEGVATSAEDKAGVEPVDGEVVGEDVPAAVEAEPVNEAVAEDSQTSAVSEGTPAVEAAIEETPASVEAEPVAEIASEETLAIEATLEPVEPEPVTEIREEVASAPVEAEPASEESPAPATAEDIAEDIPGPSDAEVAIEETSVSVGAEPVAEAAREEPAVAESAVGENPAPGEAETVVIEETPVEIATNEAAKAGEEIPVAVEAEPVVEVTTSEETPVPVGAEPPVVSEESPVVVEAGPTVEAATTEETPDAGPVVSEESAAVVEAEPTAEVATTDETPAPIEAEPVVEVTTSEETPAPVKAEPVVEVTASDETPVPVEAEHVVSDETAVVVEAEPATQVAGIEAPFTDSKPITDISRDEAPAPVEAELITSETAPTDTEPVAEVTEAAPVAARSSAEVASQDVPVPVEAEPTPETVNEETSTAAVESEPIVSEEAPVPIEAEPESEPVAEITSEIIEASVAAETEVVATETAQDGVPAQGVETKFALADIGAEVVPKETHAAAEIANEAVPVDGEVAPVEAQEVPCESSITSVEAEDAPVEVAQEEIGAPAAVEPTESLTEDTLGQVADTESEVAVEPILKEQGVFEAGIKNDTEVALEDASVALATNTVEETSPTVSSESMKESNVEAQPATENGHLSSDVLEPSIKECIPAEDQLAEPIEEAVGAELLTGLKTENLYIQTSLDTTTFTPIVDSGIDLKEQESQPSRLLSIAEEIERPKSPWSSSFQVTTIGRGELPEEDVDNQDAQSDSNVVELVDAVAAASLVLTVEDVAAKQEAPATDSADGQPLGPGGEPWTASYSVHSQGTLAQASAEPTEDVLVVDEHYVDEVIAPAETVVFEHQDKPDVNAEETEIQVEAGNEQIPEATTVPEDSVKSASDNETKEHIEVVSADITEPQSEVIVTTMPVTTLADEDINQVVEEEQGANHTLVDPPESSAKTWTPSYSVHDQGTSTVLEEAVIPVANTGALETEALPTSKEPAVQLPILSISTESVESTVLEAPAESWTPSYSVHSQGSPSITPAELDEASAETEPTTDRQPSGAWTPSYSVHSQGSPMVSAKEIDEASETETPEPPAESWTPSYSIHSQGTPLVTPKDLEETSAPDVEPLEVSTAVESTESTAFQDPWTSPLVSKEISVAELVHDSQNENSVQTTTDEQVDKNIEATLAAVVVPVIAITAVEAAAETLAAVGESEPSTKHWTSSYSIHSQTLKDEHPTNANDDTDEPEVQNSNAQDQETPDVEPSATAEIDVTSSVDKTILPVLSVSIDEAAINAEPNHTTSDVPERPWTPSYSVTQQGSNLSHQDEDKTNSQPVVKVSVSSDSEPHLNEVQEPNAVQLRPGYNMAATEDFARDEKFMLFGLRAIVAYLWVLPNWLSVTRSSSESSHSRQDSSSSSSSKFFPGGWFTPKPNEGRTSLDVAQGEFAPSPKVTTTTDVFETVNVENEAGASTRTMADGDGTDGQKRKWCVVM